MPRRDPAIVLEDELRRYLRHASTLLAATPRSGERAASLRRARHWIAAALAGVDQLLREVEITDAETQDRVDPHRLPRQD